jgi:hypothetical protein
MFMKKGLTLTVFFSCLFMFANSQTDIFSYENNQIDCAIAKTDFKVYLTDNIEILSDRTKLSEFGKCYIKYGKKDLERFDIAQVILDNEPGLVYLIVHSLSLENDEEKQSWFNLLPMMNKEQTDKLYDILSREFEKIAMINIKYATAKEGENDGRPKVILAEDLLLLGVPLNKKNHISIWQYKKNTNKYQDYFNESMSVDSAMLMLISPAEYSYKTLYKIDDSRFKTVTETYENILYGYDLPSYWEVYSNLRPDYTASFYIYLVEKYSKNREKAKQVLSLLGIPVENYFTGDLKTKITETKTWVNYSINHDIKNYPEMFRHYQIIFENRGSVNLPFKYLLYDLFNLTFFEYYRVPGCNDFTEAVHKRYSQHLQKIVTNAVMKNKFDSDFILLNFASQFAVSEKTRTLASEACNLIKRSNLLSSESNFSNKWYFLLTNVFITDLQKQKMDYGQLKNAFTVLADKADMKNESETRDAAFVEFFATYMLAQAIENSLFISPELRQNAYTTATLYAFPSSGSYGYLEKHMIDLMAAYEAQTQQTKTGQMPDALAGAKFYGLMIGINKYSSPDFKKLNNAVNDARSLGNILHKEYDFSIDSLYDEKATKGGIMSAINNIRNKIDSNTSVIIFYAGHGFYDKETDLGYIVSSDVTAAGNFWEMICYNDIQAAMLPLSKKAKHILFISDACYSGALTKRGLDLNIQAGENTHNYFSKLYQFKSTTALTSGSIEEVSDAGNTAYNSIFTEYLIKALRENNEMLMDGIMLFDRVRKFSNQVSQTPVFKPIPGTVDEGGQFIFRKKIK